MWGRSGAIATAVGQDPLPAPLFRTCSRSGHQGMNWTVLPQALALQLEIWISEMRDGVPVGIEN